MGLGSPPLLREGRRDDAKVGDAEGKGGSEGRCYHINRDKNRIVA
jgi:hypothetical protein